MDQFFELTVFYKGEQLDLTANLIRIGYGHQFQVKVNNQKIFFELDEENNYRAINYDPKKVNYKKIDLELLQLIAEALKCIS